MIRCRITFRKTEPLRYTGNLDLQKIWERYLRRAGLPVAYSQGFHPQPRIQQACPLPLGFLSEAEMVDVFLDDDSLTGEMIKTALNDMPYPGIEIATVDLVDIAEASLSSRVTATDVQVEFIETVQPLTLLNQVSFLLGSASLPRTRRDKIYDLRPLIEEMSILPTRGDQETALHLRLSARQGATGRPEEVVAALGYDANAARYIRTRIIFDN